ncbi:MAG: O-antigen ligase family protein [Actinomycetota bacterium]
MPDTVVLYCLYALVGLLPLAFAYPTYDIFELTKLTVLRLVTLTMAGAWSWKIFRSRRLEIARTPIDWFILAYLAVMTLAAIFSPNIRQSLLGDYGRFEGLLTILNYGAVFMLTGSLIRDNTVITDRRVFLRSLFFTTIAAADIMSLYGAFQRFGMDFLVWSSAGTDLSRAFSTLGNPIYVAAYLTIILSLAIALFMAEKNLPARIFLGASTALMISALIFTYSRAGWAGFLVSLAVMAVLGLIVRVRGARVESREPGEGKRRNIIAAAVLIVVIVAVAAVSVTVSSRVASTETRSAFSRALSSLNLKSSGVADRIFLWESAVAMIKDRPALGWGPDTFGTYFPRYHSVEFVQYELKLTGMWKARHQNRPHSDILQAGTSAGILGIISYLAFLGAFFFFAVKQLWRTAATAFDKALLVGIIAGLAGYYAQLQFSFNTIAISPIVWLLMAVVFLVGEPSRGVSFKLDWPQPAVIFVGAGVAVAILAGAITAVRQLAADYYFDQGVTAMEIPDSFTANQAFGKAMKLNPYEPEYPNYGGTMSVEIAKASKDAETATTALTTAIEYEDIALALNPDMPGFHYNMGNAKYYYSMLPGLDKVVAEKSMKEALREYIIAVETDPNNPDIHFNLASAYMRFSQKEKAIAELKKGLAINPSQTVAKNALKKLEEGK